MHMVIRHVRKPYKTCGILMNSKPKSQIGIQNDQRSIRFIDKMHMASRHVAKPYKPCLMWRLMETYGNHGNHNFLK